MLQVQILWDLLALSREAQRPRWDIPYSDFRCWNITLRHVDLPLHPCWSDASSKSSSTNLLERFPIILFFFFEDRSKTFVNSTKFCVLQGHFLSLVVKELELNKNEIWFNEIRGFEKKFFAPLVQISFFLQLISNFISMYFIFSF